MKKKKLKLLYFFVNDGSFVYDLCMRFINFIKC